MFFEGSVAEAIQASRRELRPLIVLLTGFDQGSRQVQDALMEQEGEEWAKSSIMLALEDDLANTDRSQFGDAKNFRAFCPVEQLPTVVMVSPTGATLAKVAGVTTAAELRSQLSQAFAAFRQQQQQMLAAQAALLAASAAGATPPAAPAAAPVAAPAASAVPATAPAAAAPAAAAPAAPTPAPAAVPSSAAAHAAETEEDMPALEPMSSDGEEAAAAAAGPAAGAAAGAAGGGPPQEQQAAAAPDPARIPYRLQFRFTDASTLRAGFTGASLLAEVFRAVDDARQAGGRPPLAYVLVQAQPRRVLGAAEEGLTLTAAGVQPRTSLQVIPHATAGHQPAAAAAVAAAEAAGAAGDAEMREAAAGADAEGAAAMEVEEWQQAQQAQQQSAAAPAEVQLQVRLSNGDTLRRAFPLDARLSAVLDWVDERRTDRGAYQLSQPYPKRTFCSEDLGSTLLELGFSSRLSLVLELLPAQPKAPAPRQAAAGAAPAAATAATAAGPVELSVRLTNVSSLQRSFGPGTKLAAVLDWIDAERTDRGAYKLTQAHPRRTFFSGDLGSTLQELGFSGRVSLLLELLPAKPKPKPAPAAPPPENKLPDMFDLQFKLTNGEQLRGSFPPESTLQQVCHYLDTHRTDGGAPYSLVQPYPKRRFGADDMQQPLLALGLQPRQLLLLEAAEAPAGGSVGGGWSLGGLLSSAASYLNPYAYLRGPAGTPHEQQAQQSQQQAGAAAAAAAAAERRLAAGGSGSSAAGDGDGSDGSGGSGGVQRGARKCPFSSTGSGGPNIHTLASSSDRADEGDANKFWNGNSTQFGGGPPPGQQ